MITPLLRRVPLLALALLGVHPSADDPRDGRELLALMRRQVHPYHTLTFVQTTKFPNRPDETWYESLEVPGRLRIDIAPLDSQRVIIFRNDSLYAMRAGRPPRAQPYVHALLFLIGDVFVVPMDTVQARLTRWGYDLAKVHADSWDGRPVWVVGAERGDSTSPQFWVDQERLYLVRLVEHAPQQGEIRVDSRVLAHQRFGDLWVETEMVFLLNGVEQQREVYHDVRVNAALDPWTFEVGEYRRPGWIGAVGP